MLMRISSIIFAVPGIILLIFYGLELSAMSQCQDIGLFYDVISKECVTTKPAFNSFYMRNSGWVNGLLGVASIGALAMCYAMLGRAKAKHS